MFKLLNNTQNSKIAPSTPQSLTVLRSSTFSVESHKSPSKKYLSMSDKVFMFEILCFVFAIILVFSQQYSQMITRSTDFDYKRAWADLPVISNESHPFGSIAHEKVRDYLIDRLNVLKDDAISNGHQVELHTDDTSNTLLVASNENEGIKWLFETQNIWFKLKGKRNSSILVSGHYDSGLFSHGAADDGIACAVMLEVIRSLTSKMLDFRFEHNIIFLFNSPEEIGLLGSVSFASHQNTWADQNIIAFCNMEAAGVSGKEFLFRALGSELIDLYSKTVPLPYANVIGNDVFKLGIVRGDTDYRVYAREKQVPGIDLAFYHGRPFYHTRFDRLDHVNEYSVNHMGSNVLTFVKSLANSQVTEGKPGSVYYDLVGWSMFSYSFTAALSVSVTFIFVTIIRVKWSFLLAKALGMYFMSWVAILLTCGIIGLLMQVGNQPIAYGYPWTFFILIVFTALVTLTILVCIGWKRQRFGDKIILDGLELFYSCFQLANIVMNSNGVGMLFFISWWHGCLILSRLISACFVSERSEERYVDVTGSQKSVNQQDELTMNFVKDLISTSFQTVLPAIITLEFAVAIVESIGASVGDGSSAVIVAAFYGFIVNLLLIPSIKNLVNLSKHILTIILRIYGLIFFILLLVCLLTFPFSQTKPLRGIYSQAYDVTDPGKITSSIVLVGNYQNYYKTMISSSDLEVTNITKVSTRYRFHISAEKYPLYAHSSNYQWKPEVIQSSQRSARIKVDYPPSTKFCLVQTMCRNCTISPQFPSGIPKFEFSEFFNFGGLRMPIITFHPQRFNESMVFRQAAVLARNWNSSAEFIVEWSPDDSLLQMMAACFVDEVLPNKQADFIRSLHETIPKWSIFMGLGTGMSALTFNFNITST